MVISYSENLLRFWCEFNTASEGSNTHTNGHSSMLTAFLLHTNPLLIVFCFCFSSLLGFRVLKFTTSSALREYVVLKTWQWYNSKNVLSRDSYIDVTKSCAHLWRKSPEVTVVSILSCFRNCSKLYEKVYLTLRIQHEFWHIFALFVFPTYFSNFLT